ncbi:hypothetical protein [Streptomyces sirii]|uniref:hypothetical protein n=1 Tax=Streptomyces sirii TaxID=3127701 RepID=UPI003D36FB44
MRADPAPRSVEELRDFLRGLDLAAADHREAVVVYITGHGLRRQAARHYLMLPRTQPYRLLSTAFPTSELVTSVLDSEAEHGPWTLLCCDAPAVIASPRARSSSTPTPAWSS